MNTTSYRRVPLALFIFLTGACFTATAQSNIRDFFSKRQVNASPPSELQGRGVKRIRAVIPNSGIFSNGKAPQTTRMTVFPDVTLIVNWTAVEKVQSPTGLVWSGNVVGASGGRATLVISGKNMTGNVTRGDGIVYEIRTTNGNRWWVREVDQKELPKESEPPKF